ncbi:hypothetical protein [Alkalicoccus chagannorensis]|uniref:hypothetical protein n=1 Tax=Alkalicoccus chagannorensis TaxID=427072 RepID=UPI0003FA06A6|nr:hypothetical protein [Alkalicoccus chagannorensis]
MENRYHCCATCEHFHAAKGDAGMVYHCIRLGYETRPEYKFNCWEPREAIRKKLAEEQERS